MNFSGHVLDDHEYVHQNIQQIPISYEYVVVVISMLSFSLFPPLYGVSQPPPSQSSFERL